tara:strand:+ start:2083 stop:2574 length:492 start_codon:yes stop_codon:yes gene_type:complete
MKLKLKKMKGVKEIMLCAGVLLLVFLLSKYVFKGTILEGMEAKGTDLTKDDKEVLDKQKVEFKKKMKDAIEKLSKEEKILKNKHTHLIDDELVNLSKKLVNVRQRVFKEENRLKSVDPSSSFHFINSWAMNSALGHQYTSLEGGSMNKKEGKEEKEEKKGGMF